MALKFIFYKQILLPLQIVR